MGLLVLSTNYSSGYLSRISNGVRYVSQILPDADYRQPLLYQRAQSLEQGISDNHPPFSHFTLHVVIMLYTDGKDTLHCIAPWLRSISTTLHYDFHMLVLRCNSCKM